MRGDQVLVLTPVVVELHADPPSLSMSLEKSDVLHRLDVNKAGVLDVSIEHLERFPV